MIAPDASERECIGSGDEPDASDAFEAPRSAFEPANAATLDRHGSGGKQGAPNTPDRRGNAAHAERGPGRVALLDSLSPPAPSATYDHTGEPPEAFERRVPCEVFHAVWRMLDLYRGAPLDLASITLTSPDSEGILEAVQRLALDAAHDPGSGVLLARDVGTRNAHVHFHGLVLTPDRGALRESWHELAGARADLSRATPITGWRLDTKRREGLFARNLASVVWYAFKPWPEAHGRRSLDRDVVASGVLDAPWRAARAALEAPSEGTRASAGKHRTCPRCGEPFPPGKRPHARWCSAACRAGAWETQRRAARVPGSKASDLEARTHTVR